jgi:hypothetical protein
MSAERWERLRGSLAAAGIDTAVSTKPYPGGISRSITILRPGHLIEIHDSWWPKNDQVWTGWQTWLEDRSTGISIRNFRRTKKRSEVVDAVRAALKIVSDAEPQHDEASEESC